MKIIIGRDALLDGLQRVFNVVPQKPTLPVLSNFLLRFSPEHLIISGTDMDMSITTSLECTIEGEGAIAVNAKHFINIIRELPVGDVTIIIENERVTIEFKNGCSSIMGMSPADFPIIKDSVEGISIAISGADLIEMVDKTSYAVAVDRSRISLTGVYWRVSSNEICMVSTDGHRLSLFSKHMDIDTDKVFEVIVPPKALNHVSRIFSREAELKSVVFGERIILFSFDTTSIFSKLIEGPYPDFRQVIPADNSKKVYISTEKLLEVVRRISVLSNSITHLVRFSFSSGLMEVTANNVDVGGEANESLSVRYEGDPLVVGFNANFLLEILRKVGSDEVLMELETFEEPCIFKPVKVNENEEHIYLIMPLRLNE